MIKAVTFDLWNTLISEGSYEDLRVELLTKILNEEGIPREHNEVRKAYFAAHERAHKIGRKENYRYVSPDERLGYTLEDLRASLPTNLKTLILKEFKETILRCPPSLVEGVNDVLRFLKSNYRLGIICDTSMTPGKVLRIMLERAQVLGFFEATAFSDEVGYNKPHRLIFETALGQLRVNPSEAVHVGDLIQTDIAGAKAIGMRAIWFNRKGTVNTGQYSPDFQIAALPQLTEVLRKIS